jgi:hypothetical protein
MDWIDWLEWLMDSPWFYAVVAILGVVGSFAIDPATRAFRARSVS